MPDLFTEQQLLGAVRAKHPELGKLSDGQLMGEILRRRPDVASRIDIGGGATLADNMRDTTPGSDALKQDPGTQSPVESFLKAAGAPTSMADVKNMLTPDGNTLKHILLPASAPVDALIGAVNHEGDVGEDVGKQLHARNYAGAAANVAGALAPALVPELLRRLPARPAPVDGFQPEIGPGSDAMPTPPSGNPIMNLLRRTVQDNNINLPKAARAMYQRGGGAMGRMVGGAASIGEDMLTEPPAPPDLPEVDPNSPAALRNAISANVDALPKEPPPPQPTPATEQLKGQMLDATKPPSDQPQPRVDYNPDTHEVVTPRSSGLPAIVPKDSIGSAGHAPEPMAPPSKFPITSNTILRATQMLKQGYTPQQIAEHLYTQEQLAELLKEGQ